MTAAVSSPFRGLAPFGDSELDELLFFGRERETEIVTANLIAARLTVLYGPSGVGKSSLLQAGVARRIRAIRERHAGAHGPDLACVVFSSWADDPAPALSAAIGDAVRPLVSPTAPEPPDDARLVEAAEHWSLLLNGDLCLVLDQFEELFVYRGDATDFLDELAALVSRIDVRTNALIAIRDDELARLSALKQRLPDVFANAHELERLTRDAARAAILGPLDHWNDHVAAEDRIDLEPDLVDEVLDATAVDEGRVEAPYLQLVMEQIWASEAGEGSRTLRLSTLRRLGGARSIVRAHLDRALGALAPGEQEAAARMFEHLVTPSGSKIAHRASDLARFARIDDGATLTLLDRLGRDRIVHSLDDAGPDRRYEIFHDVLAQAIVDWSARRDLEAVRHRQRRLLVVAAGAVLLSLVMVAVAVYALVQRSDARAQARHARGSGLAAAALGAIQTDPEIALRLAREAARYERSPQIESVLRTTLGISRGRAVLKGGGAPILATGFVGGEIATVDTAGVLRVFPPRTGRALSAHRLLPRVRAAAFAADSAEVAVAARQLVEVVALRGGGRSFAFRVPSPVRALAIDGRGDRVAVSTRDGRVIVRGAAGTVVSLANPATPTRLALDEAGDTLAAAVGHRMLVWRASRRSVAHFAVRENVVLAGVALTPDGGNVAAAGTDGAARVWRATGGRPVAYGLGPDPMTAIVFTSDARYFAVGSVDGTSRVFSAATGRLVAILSGHRDVVTSVAMSGSGRLLVAGAADGRTRVWESGLTPELSLVARPVRCCGAIAALEDDKVIVGAGRRAIVYRGRRREAVYSQGSPVTAVSAAGRAVVTGGRDGRVRIFGPVHSVFALDAPVSAVAGSDDVVVAATRAGAVQVRTAEGVRLVAFHERAGVEGIAVSPDGRLVATAGNDGVARIRDARSGSLVHPLIGHSAALTSVAFSPDGSLVASTGFDRDVRVWDVRSGAEEYLIRPAHFAVVSSVSFSPDGRWIVTAGPTTAGLWYASTGVRVAYLRGHKKRLVGAVFAGRDVVTASRDGTVRSFRCDICGTFDELTTIADRRIAATGGGLTPDERRHYLIP